MGMPTQSNDESGLEAAFNELYSPLREQDSLLFGHPPEFATFTQDRSTAAALNLHRDRQSKEWIDRQIADATINKELFRHQYVLFWWIQFAVYAMAAIGLVVGVVMVIMATAFSKDGATAANVFETVAGCVVAVGGVVAGTASKKLSSKVSSAKGNMTTASNALQKLLDRRIRESEQAS
ncbi:hypothetical protein [Tsukamurella tyrosinosolvens]|uniref:hypothetical protein n=1 Tax=Tsukamurella tyrosinosolvens TaxID=57704 RepID=UPI0011C08218|nr:hypothetical protein [Tsukamurella tyrosinosolvens]